MYGTFINIKVSILIFKLSRKRQMYFIYFIGISFHWIQLFYTCKYVCICVDVSMTIHLFCCVYEFPIKWEIMELKVFDLLAWTDSYVKIIGKWQMYQLVVKNLNLTTVMKNRIWLTKKKKGLQDHQTSRRRVLIMPWISIVYKRVIYFIGRMNLKANI